MQLTLHPSLFFAFKKQSIKRLNLNAFRKEFDTLRNIEVFCVWDIHIYTSRSLRHTCLPRGVRHTYIHIFRVLRHTYTQEGFKHTYIHTYIHTCLALAYMQTKHTYINVWELKHTYIHVCTLVRLPEVPPLTIQKKIN